jgi:hypothetical protein
MTQNADFVSERLMSYDSYDYETYERLMRSLMLRLMLRRSRLRSLSDEFFIAPGGEPTELVLTRHFSTLAGQKKLRHRFTELTDDVDRC